MGRIYGSSDLDSEEIRKSCPSVFLVSACLVGIPCRYDGGSCSHGQLQALAARGDVLDGHAQVVDVEGNDVTTEFLAGAQMALHVARRWGIQEAILKARSPSCGTGQIYDGSFNGRLMEGDGVAAALLRREGITVKNEEK